MNKRLKLISVQDNLTMGNYSFEYFESGGNEEKINIGGIFYLLHDHGAVWLWKQ